MKTVDLTCKTTKHALNAIHNYPVILYEWIVLPPDFIFSPSHTNNNCTIFMNFEHHINKEKMSINLAIPLFEKTIEELIKKYGSIAEEKLMKIALTIKHDKLIKYMWRYISEDNKKIMMIEILGHK